MKLTSRFAASVLALGLAVGLTGRVALAGDADAFLGTWKLNAANSSLPQGGPPIDMTLTVSDAGGGKYKSMTEMSVAGQTYKVEITFAIDGKDYSPVVTPPPAGAPPTTQSYEKVSARSYKSSTKMQGQVMATSTSEVSADGKTMTVTTSGAGAAAGAGAMNKLVFDKK
jgi:hypothetical protein